MMHDPSQATAALPSAPAIDQAKSVRTMHLKGDYGRIGGPESLLRETLPALRAAGQEIVFASLQREPSRPFAAEIVPRGDVPTVALRWYGLAGAPLAARELLAELRRRGTQVLHTHDMRAALVAALVQPFFRGKWVGHAHGWLGSTHTPLYRAFESIDRRLLRRADRLVVGSHATAAEAAKLGLAGALVIPNAVPVPVSPTAAERQASRAAFGLADGIVAIGSFGRLHAGKGHDLVIAAVAALKDRPLALLVAGEGEEREPLQRAIVEAGLGDRARLVGRTPDVGRFLAALDIVVVASRKESLPLAALEAMAASRAVVVSAVGDLPIVVRDDLDGLVVDPDDPIALAAALARLADDALLRDRVGRAARSRVEEGYSIAAHAAAVARLDEAMVSP
jgi:glycosyltransferase involved in cell wall biosynthesis